MRRSLQRTYSALWLPAAILLAAAAPAKAEVRIERDAADTSRHKIVISGEIDVATLTDFSQSIADERIAGAESRLVELESPGGSLSSAMAIGGLIREGHFDTGVAAHGKCYSACVLILAAGVHRTVASGKVGVHRPYYDRGHYSPGTPGSPARAEAQYGPVTEGIQEYLTSMGMRDGLMDAMMKVPSKFMRHLTSTEVSTYGLDNSNPCKVVRVASLAADQAQPANMSVNEPTQPRKAKRAAAHKKGLQRASNRSARQVRQAARLTGPWGRAAPVPSAARLEREHWNGRS